MTKGNLVTVHVDDLNKTDYILVSYFGLLVHIII